jgi:hypothetical protein
VNERFLTSDQPPPRFNAEERRNYGRRVKFPTPFRQMLLGIMDPNAHHYASGVPLYNLTRMQNAMEARGDLVVWRMSWRAYARICRLCKLYDYNTNRWVGFDDDRC